MRGYSFPEESFLKFLQVGVNLLVFPLGAGEQRWYLGKEKNRGSKVVQLTSREVFS